MESLKRLRAPLRSSFTKVEKKLTELLLAEIKDVDAIETQFAILKMNHGQIEKNNDKINVALEATSVEELDEESLAKETESVEIYRNKFIELEIKAARALRQSVNLEPTGSKGESHLDAMLQKLTEILSDKETRTSNQSSRRKYKLPDLELKKFDGDLKEWLSFWAQFSKIDKDEDIPREDKFQYLIQSTAPGSRAREIVNSFPPTAEHYQEAIECLKSRFGRTDMLIDVYVRELLSIVLNRVTNRERYSLVKLYDQLETQLRSLKVLGVTSEQCVSILYPLVESCLPVELLKIWERKQVGGRTLADPEGGGSDTRDNKLELLMDFLRIEVQSAEKVAIAAKGFGFHEAKNEINRPLPHVQKPIATEMELHSIAQAAPGTFIIAKECLFCADKTHASEKCRGVTNLTLEEKRNLLKKTGACFKCLKRAKHVARFCKARVSCSSCSGRHYEIMCPVEKVMEDEKLVSERENKVSKEKDPSREEDGRYNTVQAWIKKRSLFLTNRNGNISEKKLLSDKTKLKSSGQMDEDIYHAEEKHVVDVEEGFTSGPAWRKMLHSRRRRRTKRQNFPSMVSHKEVRILESVGGQRDRRRKNKESRPKHRKKRDPTFNSEENSWLRNDQTITKRYRHCETRYFYNSKDVLGRSTRKLCPSERKNEEKGILEKSRSSEKKVKETGEGEISAAPSDGVEGKPYPSPGDAADGERPLLLLAADEDGMNASSRPVITLQREPLEFERGGSLERPRDL